MGFREEVEKAIRDNQWPDHLFIHARGQGALFGFKLGLEMAANKAINLEDKARIRNLAKELEGK